MKKFIIPQLKSTLKIDSLIPSVLQIFIDLIESKIITKPEFIKDIWPNIKALITGKEIPAQALFLIVLNIRVFCELITKQDLQTHFMPLVIKCFDCKVVKLQDLALKNTEYLIKFLEFIYIKTKILPKVLILCTDSSSELRRTAIITLSKIYHIFDRTIISDQILVTLDKIKKMSNDPTSNMLILGIYEGISQTLGIEVIFNLIKYNLNHCFYFNSQ